LEVKYFPAIKFIDDFNREKAKWALAIIKNDFLGLLHFVLLEKINDLFE